ncbi:hypothetical protein COU76_02170 [Candidatus Peregrinibacteria bacterium CG10_big_fil_rev_8_21_14_0_10_49_10]|nr:MAG: hypothetical protein COU76_02170 [Candidatus Peregrinibacteria bacterium CG10_big_fil_rev_8_21_14_0_10_49_10]
MKIAIDIREACTEKRTGKGQWTYGFVSELLQRKYDLLLYTDAEIPEEWKVYAPNVHRMQPGIFWHMRTVFSLVKSKDVEVYVSPSSYIVPSLLPSRIRCIPVVHDLIAFRREPHDRKAQMIERLTLGRTVGNAAHICVVSESTKRDLLERYPSYKPDAVTVVYAGPMELSPPANIPDGKTILCPATLSPRKNQLRLIQAYAALPDALRSQFRLVLAGNRGWHDREIVEKAKETPGVEWQGFVSVDRYNALLSSCTILALPSLYEGFGMQILDALQRGIPVLTSNRGSLPEVTGQCAILVDPEDVESMTDGLQRILTSKEYREDVRISGRKQASFFTWKQCVDFFLPVLKQLQYSHEVQACGPHRQIRPQ